MLATFVFTVHYPALGAYFAADDFLWLAHGAWEDAGRAFTASWGLGTAYRPLARLSFVADARAFGETAWPWHFENLLLHVLAAFLVAALARQAGLRRIDAALAGLLFAAVPVAWENADWISGRTGLFMVVFGLVCALCWLKWLRGQAYWLAAAAVAEATGLLCYEPASVIPLALLAISPSLARQGLSWRRISAGLAVLGLGVAVILAIRAIVLGTVFLAVDIPAAQTLPGMARNLAGLMLHGWSDFGALGFCGAVGVLTVGLANSRTRRHVAALLAAAFLLYMPFWLVAGVTERFFYAAAAPLALALVVAGTAWRGLRPVLAVLVVLFALRSHAQAEGVRDAGQLNRALLTQIAALPADGRALVFDAVPTHLGAYYLLWGAFDIAAVQARAAPGIAARSETVLDNPALLRKVLAGPTRFMSYDAASGRLTDLPRATWLARHPAAMAR